MRTQVYNQEPEQGKIPDSLKYFTIGMGILGIILLIVTLVILSYNQKNEQYKAAQIEYTQKA